MDELSIIQTLTKTDSPRTCLYLNIESIDNYFSQRLAGLTNLIETDTFGYEISASLLQLINAKSSGSKGKQIGISLSPILKSILLEILAEKDGNLQPLDDKEILPNMWLSYSGPGKFVIWNEKLKGKIEGVSDEQANDIESEQKIQESLLQFRKPEIRTLLWLPIHDHLDCCAILSSDWMNINYFSSYRDQPFQGMFGRLEKTENGIQYIAPLSIWNI